MNPETQKTAIRLAMRREGDWWVAYAATTDTMQGAVELGRVAMAIVQDQARHEAFLDLMRSYMRDFLTAAGARVQHWNDPVPAPEHERAGRA